MQLTSDRKLTLALLVALPLAAATDRQRLLQIHAGVRHGQRRGGRGAVPDARLRRADLAGPGGLLRARRLRHDAAGEPPRPGAGAGDRVPARCCPWPSAGESAGRCRGCTITTWRWRLWRSASSCTSSSPTHAASPAGSTRAPASGSSACSGVDLSSMGQLFWVVWAALFLAAFVAGNIASNQIGRSLLAVKMSAAAAASVGIDVVRAKAFVFADRRAADGPVGRAIRLFRALVQRDFVRHRLLDRAAHDGGAGFAHAGFRRDRRRLHHHHPAGRLRAFRGLQDAHLRHHDGRHHEVHALGAGGRPAGLARRFARWARARA